MPINKDTPTSEIIDDFVHSKNPKFAGKSKAERVKQAVAASYKIHKEEISEKVEVTIKKQTSDEPNVSKRHVSYDVYHDGKYHKTFNDINDAMDHKEKMHKEEVDLDENVSDEMKRKIKDRMEKLRITDPKQRHKIAKKQYARADEETISDEKVDLDEARAPGRAYVKKFYDPETKAHRGYQSSTKWGKVKYWRNADSALQKAKQHAGVDKLDEDTHLDETAKKQHIEVTDSLGQKKRIPVHPDQAYAAVNHYRKQPGTKARIVSEETPPFDGPYTTVGEKKDKFGNVIEPKNRAKHLAKKAMKANEEVELDEALGRPRKDKGYTINPVNKQKLHHDNPAHMDLIRKLRKNGHLPPVESAPKEHIINRLRQARTNMQGGQDITYENGKTHHVPSSMAAKTLDKYNGMKPADKEDFQAKIHRSHEDHKEAIKEEFMSEKKLTKPQKDNLDKNHNGKLDAEDFKMLRSMKKEELMLQFAAALEEGIFDESDIDRLVENELADLDEEHLDEVSIKLAQDTFDQRRNQFDNARRLRDMAKDNGLPTDRYDAAAKTAGRKAYKDYGHLDRKKDQSKTTLQKHFSGDPQVMFTTPGKPKPAFTEPKSKSMEEEIEAISEATDEPKMTAHTASGRYHAVESAVRDIMAKNQDMRKINQEETFKKNNPDRFKD